MTSSSSDVDHQTLLHLTLIKTSYLKTKIQRLKNALLPCVSTQAWDQKNAIM